MNSAELSQVVKNYWGWDWPVSLETIGMKYVQEDCEKYFAHFENSDQNCFQFSARQEMLNLHLVVLVEQYFAQNENFFNYHENLDEKIILA